MAENFYQELKAEFPRAVAEFEQLPVARRPGALGGATGQTAVVCERCFSLVPQLCFEDHATWHVSLNLKLFVTMKAAEEANKNLAKLAQAVAEYLK